MMAEVLDTARPLELSATGGDTPRLVCWVSAFANDRWPCSTGCPIGCLSPFLPLTHGWGTQAEANGQSQFPTDG